MSNRISNSDEQGHHSECYKSLDIAGSVVYDLSTLLADLASHLLTILSLIHERIIPVLHYPLLGFEFGILLIPDPLPVVAVAFRPFEH